MSKLKNRLEKLAVNTKPEKLNELCSELDNSASLLDKSIEMIQNDSELTEYFRSSNENIALFDEMSNLRIKMNKLIMDVLR